MTSVPPFDATARTRPRFPRVLDEVEVRVLGSLMEKQLSTPEYYPLTVNALVAACSQKSNREPVMELAGSDVQRALDRLQDEKLVWKVMGGRVVRYDHNLDHIWHLDRPSKAVMTLLFLRGPQTVGELRGRSDRLFTFDSVSAIEELLRDMASHSEPLVRELARRPGQKEVRWMHLAGGAGDPVEIETPSATITATGEPLSVRVQRLEEELATLRTAFEALKKTLGE